LVAVIYLLSLFAFVGAPVQNDTCTSVSACAFFSNQSDGPAISALSADGNAIVGRTRNDDISRTSFVAGVYGESLTTNGGLFAGVFGFSASKINGYGVAGQGAFGVLGYGQRYGVLGLASTAQGEYVGVEGYGPVGVAGLSRSNAPGVFGMAEGDGPESYGVRGSATAGGVVGEGRTGVIATNGGYTGQTALQLEPTNGGLALVSFGANGLPTASLDSSGDFVLAGKLTLDGTPLSAAATSSGARYTAYGDRTAQPLIEDVGEARLTDGVASVPLERTFSELVDFTKPYLVFVTPEDDSNGIFVSRRTPAGFVVRENGHGRSMLAFQYRIVATPADSPGRRLPAATVVPHGSAFPRHVTIPKFDVPNVTLGR